MDQATVEARRAQVEPLRAQSPEEGETWCIVNMEWWRSFTMVYGLGCVGNLDIPLGPIDNGSLAGEYDGTISKNLALDLDYKVVPETLWDLLVTWHTNVGPVFSRTVILRGQNPSVEIYPQPCFIFAADGTTGLPDSTSQLVLLSRLLKGQELLKKAVEAAGLALTVVPVSRLWIQPVGETSFALVDPETSLDELSGNDKCTTFLVETQVGGVWPRAAIASAVGAADSATFADGDSGAPPSIFPGPVSDLVAWRNGLKAGDYVDAQDMELKWYDSRIVEIEPAFSSASPLPQVFKGTAGDKLHVHFMGWDNKYDMWFTRTSEKVQPLFTKVRNWRDFRVNDKIEMRVAGKWYACNVENVDRTSYKITVRPLDKTLRASLGDKQFEFFSDDIAANKTHVKSYDMVDYYANTSTYYSSRGNTAGRPAVSGAVGLNNLGNTCFMASMLQCMSNTEPLTRYFLADSYLPEINKDNPLGCGGHLAEAYGQLLKDMWGGRFTVVSPTEFKHQIGQKAPQFQGYQQQDSQELMSFLMDGLNEDLNRVKKKPVVEAVESDGRPDELIAQLSWEGYKKRNDSVVSDIFAGQLRSHVKCNVCDRESTTFDPFMSLSVPIPTKDTKAFVFNAMPLDGSGPVQYKAEVNAVGCIADVMAWYSTVSGVPSKEMLVGNVYSKTVHKYMSPSDALSEVYRTDNVWIFQVPELPGAAAVKEARKKALAEEAAKRKAQYGGYYNYTPYGTPVENEQDMALCVTARTVERKYQYSVAVTRQNEMCADAFVVPFRFLAGSYDAFPTGKQVHDFIWNFEKRVVKAEDLPHYSPADKLPYVVHIVKKGVSSLYYYHSNPLLQYTDEAVDLTGSTLHVQWADANAACFDEDAADAVVQHSSMSAAAKKEDQLTLYKSFERFNDEEQLGEMDMWYCNKCKEHRRAYKRMGLWKLPEVLIIHLKRFQYSQGQFFTHREKIEALVDFPLLGLDLTPFTLTKQAIPPIYDLFAVSNHSGGLGGGHYTAYAKNFESGRWYDFNDSSVSPLSDPSRVVSPTAYVLFYRRRPLGGTVSVPAPLGAAGVMDDDEDEEAATGSTSRYSGK